MINQTKIEWCSHTWNPVTGCKHACPYCYARSIANRFGTNSSDSIFLKDHVANGELVVIPGRDTRTLADAMFELNAPIYDNPYPFRFRPTFRRYLLDELRRSRTAKDIFVCSMADLFGDWVPTRWIRDVLDACSAAPQHRYLFLTKNPRRYTELGTIALLPHEENFWYGSTVTTDDDTGFYDSDRVIHTFLSMEPLLGPVNLSGGTPEWVIIGAETGNRINKVIPERKWVDDIRAFCEDNGIPVFYKDSLRKLFPDLPESRFPWK